MFQGPVWPVNPLCPVCRKLSRDLATSLKCESNRYKTPTLVGLRYGSSPIRGVRDLQGPSGTTRGPQGPPRATCSPPNWPPPPLSCKAAHIPNKADTSDRVQPHPTTSEAVRVSRRQTSPPRSSCRSSARCLMLSSARLIGWVIRVCSHARGLAKQIAPVEGPEWLFMRPSWVLGTENGRSSFLRPRS